MFHYDFIQKAFVAGFAIAIIAPIIGLFLILRRQSLLGDTLSHISLAGVALGLYLGQNPTLVNLLVIVIAAVILEILRNIYKDFSEVSIAIMTSGGTALAMYLQSISSQHSNVQIDQYLFGSILLISDEEVKILVILAIVVLILYLIFKRPLYVMAFDDDTAYTMGLPVRFMSMAFSIVTGVAISVMMPIMGAMLVSALIIIPASTAIKVSKSFTQTIIIGIIINFIGITAGLISSYTVNTPPGAAITLWFIAIFIVVSVFDSVRRFLKNKKK